MIKKLENFNMFTKLNKNLGELNGKLIIQHFYHIHIHTLTCMMNSSNFSIFWNI